jgi:hypothetical protein
MKKTVRESKDISRWISFTELKNEIERYKKEYSIPEYEDFSIEADSDYYDGTVHYLVFNRFETDEEYKDRLEKERQVKEAAFEQFKRIQEQRQIAKELEAAAEKEMYLRLKAKYEKA